MPNYNLKINNKTYELGFFVCDMEADEYAINKFNLYANNKYLIIETVVDPLGHKASQMAQQSIMG